MPGGGFLCDIGVYYLTVLVYLLGRIDRVAAMVENCKPVRIDTNPKSAGFGKPYDSPSESRVTAILHTASGITGALCLNGESAGGGFAFDLIGRKGILHLPDANRYSNDIYIETPEKGNVLVENELPSFVGRGLGPSEMAEAIREGRPHQASKEQAYHVLQIIDALLKSSQTLRFITIDS
jgi:predicted dehydrogenase